MPPLDDPSLFSSGPAGPSPAPAVWFRRTELDLVLDVYGRMVAAGLWRDYAIDALKDRAVFSIFRHASDQPLYTVEKRPALARRQGAYAIAGANGQILKRGRDLRQVLKLFDRKWMRATL